jgi:D-amino-acid dehydrogenase
MKVIVVGAGICGASTAFHLTELGAEVYVIDNSALGRATFAGAGIICPWLSKNQDPAYQKLAFAAFRYYPKLMAKLAEAGQTEIDYDLVGGLAVGESRDQLDPVIQRLESYLADGIKEIGEVQMLDPGGPKELFPCLDPRLAGVYLSGAIRLSGESVRTGMLNAACAAGAQVLSGSAVLQRTGNTVTGVTVTGAFISGDTVVIAAGAWSVNLCRTLGLELKLEPQRGQILHLRVPETDTESWPVIVPVLNDYYLLAFRDSRFVLGATRESGSGFDPESPLAESPSCFERAADRPGSEDRDFGGNQSRPAADDRGRVTLARRCPSVRRPDYCHWFRPVRSDSRTLCRLTRRQTRYWQTSGY